eukprot:5343774-Amphidinium_carterae.1
MWSPLSARQPLKRRLRQKPRPPRLRQRRWPMYQWQQLPEKKLTKPVKRTTKLPPTTRTRSPLQFGRLHRTRDPKVPTLLWRHLRLGGDTSEAQGSWNTLCWGRAPTGRLRSSDLSRCLRKGILRFCTGRAGSALAKPKACFRELSPPPKTGPFPRGHLFGSELASGVPGAHCVLWTVRSVSEGEVSEDSSFHVELPGE